MNTNRAKTHGSAGERPRTAGLVRALTPLLATTFALGWLVRAAWPRPALSTVQVGALCLLLAAALFFLLRFLEKRISSFIKGAHGEEQVARELGFLPPDFSIFHGVDCGGENDCDHVAVGPNGIFAIETKNWDGRIILQNGRIMYEGQPPDRDPLQQAARAAESVGQLLEKHLHRTFSVNAVLCFTGSRPELAAGNYSGVLVCHRDELNQQLVATKDSALDKQTRQMIGRLLSDKLD